MSPVAPPSQVVECPAPAEALTARAVQRAVAATRSDGCERVVLGLGHCLQTSAFRNIANTADHPVREFSVDPAALVRIIGSLPDGHDLTCTVHTHPGHDASPSAADIDLVAQWPRATHVIIAAGSPPAAGASQAGTADLPVVTAWRARGGAI